MTHADSPDIMYSASRRVRVLHYIPCSRCHRNYESSNPRIKGALQWCCRCSMLPPGGRI